LADAAIFVAFRRGSASPPKRCLRSVFRFILPAIKQIRGDAIPPACFQPDQNLRTRIQKSLSAAARRGRRRFRFKTASCCRRTKFSSKRLRRLRKRRTIDPKITPMMRNMGH
jgi:hypothetical protein